MRLIIYESNWNTLQIWTKDMLKKIGVKIFYKSELVIGLQY